jgi:uncharacterized Fe-S cluster protein YjdI
MSSNDRQYSNGEITVFWKPDECIHSTICYKKLIEVFNPGNRPWVNIHGSTTDKIVDVVWKCPTNALTFKWNEESKNTPGNYKSADQPVTKEEKKEAVAEMKPVHIEIMDNGPAIANGNFVITHENGIKMKMANMVSFCCCGKSANQPFCDGSHHM